MSSTISLSLGPDATRHETGPADAAIADGRLLCLLRLIAAKDHVAFADLYDAVSAHLHGDVRSRVSEPARAVAITSAVFVEVWALARFHTGSGTDVYAWLVEIAMRRISDERPYHGYDGSAAVPTQRRLVPRRQLWWTAVATSYDRQLHVTLAALLHRPPTGRLR